MDVLFLKIFNMSTTAVWLILAVLLLRLLLRRTPKALCVALWGLVAVRLICPFSIESTFSLIPSAEPLPPAVLNAAVPTIQSGIPSVDAWVNPLLTQMLPPQSDASISPMQIFSAVGASIWLIGMGVLLVYGVCSALHVHLQVRTAMRLRSNIWLCDGLSSPFILGLVRPRIFLPSDLNEIQAAHVLAHEEAHLKRRDHWWKPLGFLVLALHWFNPLVWVAYILLCHDIELACDEHVIKAFSADAKKSYSEVLLSCSLSRRTIAACPLAFGEVGVKQRIRSVLHYKKPAFWLLLISIAAILIVGLFFMTNPKVKPQAPRPYTITVRDTHSETEELTFEFLSMDLYGETPAIRILRKNSTDKELCYGRYYSLMRQNGDSFEPCPSSEDGTIQSIGILHPAGEVRPCEYALDQYDLSQSGLYRLYVEQDQLHWIDFELNYTEDGQTAAQYSPDALLHLVQNIANNPALAHSSNAYDYITARKNGFHALLAADEAAVSCFVPLLQTKAVTGLEAYIMAEVCAQITGVGHSDDKVKPWTTADEWVVLYTQSTPSTSLPETISKINFTRSWVGYAPNGASAMRQLYGEACADSEIPIVRLTSRVELEQFMKATESYFSFDGKYNDSPPLRTLAAAYDDPFFAENQLILLYVEENSGSISHAVTQVQLQDRTLSVQLKRLVPESGTADMAGWMIAFAIPAEFGTQFDQMTVQPITIS